MTYRTSPGGTNWTLYVDVRAPEVVTSTDCPSREGAKGKSGSGSGVGAMVTGPAPSRRPMMPWCAYGTCAGSQRFCARRPAVRAGGEQGRAPR